LLNITNDCVSFSARFNNRPRDIIVPLAAVEAIYAKENGQGMVFSDDDQPTTGAPPAGPDPARGRRPALTIVK
jgi:stringent starvation protein B